MKLKSLKCYFTSLFLPVYLFMSIKDGWFEFESKITNFFCNANLHFVVEFIIEIKRNNFIEEIAQKMRECQGVIS